VRGVKRVSVRNEEQREAFIGEEKREEQTTIAALKAGTPFITLTESEVGWLEQ